MRAGLLLSDVSVAEGNLDGARGWIYTALSLDPVGASAVERLRHLDVAQVAEMLAAAAAAEAAEQPIEPEAEAEEWQEETTGEEIGSEEEYYPEENYEVE